SSSARLSVTAITAVRNRSGNESSSATQKRMHGERQRLRATYGSTARPQAAPLKARKTHGSLGAAYAWAGILAGMLLLLFAVSPWRTPIGVEDGAAGTSGSLVSAAGLGPLPNSAASAFAAPLDHGLPVTKPIESIEVGERVVTDIS